MEWYRDGRQLAGDRLLPKGLSAVAAIAPSGRGRAPGYSPPRWWSVPCDCAKKTPSRTTETLIQILQAEAAARGEEIPQDSGRPPLLTIFANGKRRARVCA